MKFNLRIDSRNEQHTRFAVFANGANCGQLCMRNDEYDAFSAGYGIALWKCAVQDAGKTDPPQECDYPFCGCDPNADRVMEALLECGWEGPEEVGKLKEQIAELKGDTEPAIFAVEAQELREELAQTKRDSNIQKLALLSLLQYFTDELYVWQTCNDRQAKKYRRNIDLIRTVFAPKAVVTKDVCDTREALGLNVYGDDDEKFWTERRAAIDAATESEG